MFERVLVFLMALGISVPGHAQSPANPTATIGTSAVNGSLSTYMRSDAAPKAPLCTTSTAGFCKPDGSTITVNGSGVISGTTVGTSGAVVGLLNANKTDSGNNILTGRVSEAPCAVSGTSGTITLDLSSCGTAGQGSNVFHIGPLTGATTIAFSNPAAGQGFRLEVAANTQTVTLPACVGPATQPAMSGNSFIVYDVFDTAPTYWCPSGVQVGLVQPGFAFVNSAKATGGVTSSTTGATDMVTGSPNLFVATVTGVATLGISDSQSNTWTAGPTATDVSGSVVQQYYVYAPSTSSTQTFTGTSTTGQATIVVEAFSGAVTSPLDQTGSNTQTSGTSVTSFGATPGQNNELAVASIVCRDGTSVSINSSFTIPTNGSYDHGTNVWCTGQAHFIQGTAGALNPTYSWTGTTSAAAVIGTYK
jgi:hypothetical protein